MKAIFLTMLALVLGCSFIQGQKRPELLYTQDVYEITKSLKELSTEIRTLEELAKHEN